MSWLRLYVEVLDDPKLQRLHAPLFKTLVNLWCLAKRGRGELPSSIADIAFALRLLEPDARRAIDELVLAGLLDVRPDGRIEPHNWQKRQFTSDLSTKRVREYRERKRRRNAAETFRGTPLTDPEQTQTQNRGDSKLFEQRSVTGLVESVLKQGRGGAVSPKARLRVATALAIANADPLVALYEVWPESRNARSPDALFARVAADMYREAGPEVRAACQPLTTTATSIDVVVPATASPELRRRLRS